MKIMKKKLIEDFIIKHADSKQALQRWVDIVEYSKWRSHAELKIVFPHADYVGNEKYVFNIKGNSYRMVVVVVYIADIVIIRFIGTHADYDKIDCKTI